ncbi:DUF4129 domain-containing protein [Paenibacillus sedimenti]|uniref:DUF4129 domain-containing protein n=1 Tax=Paenibacillus sedimenti TaxID=2770274 RepID=A0A926KW36_9BACL|nr:DUF4129 domain-containing protein [Paenibacillus sedimenti]MBD0383189.1 DUF4129 domain-containing protein [Paenibacillus sedimenti]
MQQSNVQRWLQGFGMTFLWGSVELIVCFPILVLVQLYVADTPIWLTWLQLLLYYFAGCIGGTTRLLTRRIYELLFAAAASYGIAYLLQGNSWQGWVFAAIGMMPAFRGIQFTKAGWTELFPASAFIFPCMTYFIGVPIMDRIDIFHPWIGWLNGFGFCTFVIFMFTLNRTQLLRATLASTEQAQAALTETVRRLGRIWLLLLIVVVAIVAYFQQLKQGAAAIIHSFFAWVIRMLRSDAPAELPPQPSPAVQQPLFPPSEPKVEPGWFDILLQYIQVIFGYVIVIAFILVALYFIASKLAPVMLAFVRRLLHRMRNDERSTESKDFTDEKETLLEWKEIPHLWWKQLVRNWSSEKERQLKWTQLKNNRERIRFLYALLIGHAVGKGYAYNKALTPNETERELETKLQMPEHAVHAITEAYNQVRYGDIEIHDDDLNQLLKAAQPVLPKGLK